jgi:hypothetical protein
VFLILKSYHFLMTSLQFPVIYVLEVAYFLCNYMTKCHIMAGCGTSKSTLSNSHQESETGLGGNVHTREAGKAQNPGLSQWPVRCSLALHRGRHKSPAGISSRSDFSWDNSAKNIPRGPPGATAMLQESRLSPQRSTNVSSLGPLCFSSSIYEVGVCWAHRHGRLGSPQPIPMSSAWGTERLW